jgi:hypothetical protein
MAKVRITVEFEVIGPDASRARDAVEAALDAGTVQDAIIDAIDDEEIDFTIDNAVVADVTRIGRK